MILFQYPFIFRLLKYQNSRLSLFFAFGEVLGICYRFGLVGDIDLAQDVEEAEEDVDAPQSPKKAKKGKGKAKK